MQLLDLIVKIRNRPGMYVGEQNIDRLSMLLNGALLQAVDPLSDIEAIQGFSQYVLNKYSPDIERGWWAVIRFYSSNDKEAFDTALTLLEEYLMSKDSNRD